MLVQNINYQDFNGEERTEEFHFHLSVPEATRIEAEVGMDLADYAKALSAKQDPKELLAFLERIVLTSFGEKSIDGKTFRKSEQARKDFEYSQAYAELFVMLLSDPEFASKFATGIVEKAATKAKAKVAAVVD